MRSEIRASLKKCVFFDLRCERTKCGGRGGGGPPFVSQDVPHLVALPSWASGYHRMFQCATSESQWYSCKQERRFQFPHLLPSADGTYLVTSVRSCGQLSATWYQGHVLVDAPCIQRSARKVSQSCECCHLLDIAPCSLMWIDVSDVCFTSIFRAEKSATCFPLVSCSADVPWSGGYMSLRNAYSRRTKSRHIQDVNILNYRCKNPLS
jgi:hypothetical protein